VLASEARKKVSLYHILEGGRQMPRPEWFILPTTREDEMITAAQLRAARGLLDWTRTELAEAAKISPETVKNIEHGVFRPQEETAERIVRAFAERDVVFTDDEGVKIRRDAITRYEGSTGFRKFMDDLYQEAKKGNADICVSGVDEAEFIKHLGADFVDAHVKRMTDLHGSKVRCLIRDEDSNVFCSSYNDYRWVPSVTFSAVPFYVFGNNFAVVNFDKDSVMVISIASEPVSKAYRKQFEIIWKSSHSPQLGKIANSKSN